MSSDDYAWDVFISHASEDKDSLVRPLATELSRLGLRVWYDEFSLKLGDGLRETIDKGLRDSAAGLVIISPKFIEKPWPKRELEGLVAGISRGQLIVPIWYNVSRDDVYSFSPPLANTVAAIATKDASLPDLALKILERVKPELHQAYQRRLAYERMRANAKTEKVDASKIHTDGPIRHEMLPFEWAIRLRLMREALLEVCEVDWRETIDNFRKDMNPDSELVIWEFMASIYLTVVNENRLSHEERERLYYKIFGKIGAGDDSWQPSSDAPEWEKRAYSLCTFGDQLSEEFGSRVTVPAWLQQLASSIMCRASRVPERRGYHGHWAVARRRGNRPPPGKQQLTPCVKRPSKQAVAAAEVGRPSNEVSNSAQR